MPDAPPSRLKRWLKRALFLLLALAGVLVAFHRPILRHAAGWGARHFSEKAGFKLDLELEGGVVSDLSVKKLRLTGPEGSVLRKLELNNGAAHYNLWKLARKGAGEFLRDVELRDATIELDLRTKAGVKKKAKSERENYWIDHIELHDITARILTDGGEVNVSGLTLVLNQGKTGELAIRELILPSPNLRFKDVRGETLVQGRTVTLTNLALTPEVKIPRLNVDLVALKDGTLPFDIDVKSSGGTIHAEGRMENMWGQLQLDLSLQLNRVTDADVRRWTTLPEGMKWRIDDADLKLKGPPSSPANLTADLSLSASAVRVGSLSLDTISTSATLVNGALSVKGLSAKSGGNSADINGTATLPAAWSEIRNAAAHLNWEITAPQMASLFTDPTRFAGSLTGKGEVAVAAGKLTAASAAIRGADLKLFDKRIASVTGDVSTDSQIMRFKGVAIRLDAQNSAQLSGEIRLDGEQQASIVWEIAAADVPALVRFAAAPGIALPDAGSLSATGTAAFPLTEVIKGRIDSLVINADARMDGLVWQQRRIDETTLKAALRNQVMEVKSLDLRVGTANHAHLSGTVGLLGEQPAQLSWRVDFRDLATAFQLAGQPQMPPLSAGTFVSDGSASGPLAALRVQDFTHAVASGNARLSGVVWKNARLDSAELDAGLRDGRAEVRNFRVEFDPQNTVTANGRVTLDKAMTFDGDLKAGLTQLGKLAGWFELAKAPRVTAGSATVLWNGSGRVSPREIHGAGSVKIAGLKREGSADALSLELEARHDGQRAEIAKLQFTSGAIRGEATASLTETELNIPRLSVSSGALRVVEGSANVPLLMTQTPRPPVPIDPKRPLSIKLHTEKLDLAKLLAALGQKPAASGSIDADIKLNGTLGQLAGAIVVKAQNVRAAAAGNTLSPARIDVNAVFAQNRIDATATVKQAPLQTFTAKAVLPLDFARVIAEPRVALDAPVDVAIDLPDSDVAALKPFFPVLAQLEGTVGMKVRASGPVKNIQWSGTARLDVPNAELKQSTMTIRDLKARASLAGQRITIDELSAILSGGSIRGAGTIDLVPLRDPAINVRLEAKEALIVRNDAMSLRADGALTCIGTLSKAAIAGKMDLVRGRVFKEIEFLPLSLPNQLPPPPPAVSTRVKTITLPPLLSQWTFDIDVVSRDPVRLLGNVLNGGAVSDIHIGGTGAAPEVAGKISLEGARVRLPFSRLNITRGDIVFSKDAPLEPQLDLQGETVINNYFVTVRGSGPARAPKITLSSSPPLKENEIAALLATGSTVGDEGGLAGEAANRAAFLVVSRLYRKLLGKSAPKRYDEEPPRLTFSFSPLSTGTSQRGVTATYQVSENVEAVGTVGDRGFRGLLHYLIRFR